MKKLLTMNKHIIILLFALIACKSQPVDLCQGDIVAYYVPRGYKKPVHHCRYVVIEMDTEQDFTWLNDYEGKAPSRDWRYKKYDSMIECDKRKCRVAVLSDKNYDWYASEFALDFPDRKFPFRKRNGLDNIN